MIKRTIDILVSLIVLVVIFPWLFIIVYIGIKCLMPGPVMFAQKRTGRNKKIFTCYKFRTLDVMPGHDGSDGVSLVRYPFGTFLRDTGLDEVPQFWNVLRGEMSIVGPRPHMLAHDKLYFETIPDYGKRFDVRPGITGWAQVNGLRGDNALESVKKRVQYDLWYIDHQNTLLDFEIMCRTAKVLIK